MVALVIGSAKGVEIEVALAMKIEPSTVLATNSIVADFPWNIDAAVTLHPKHMAGWRKARIARNYGSIPHYVSHINKQGSHSFDFITDVIDYRWPEQAGLPVYDPETGSASGSSGHYAIKVAMELFGETKILLAGVPMTQERRHYNNSNLWNSDIFKPAWKLTYDRLKNHVRSMSGWTADMFGFPDEEWLKK